MFDLFNSLLLERFNMRSRTMFLNFKITFFITYLPQQGIMFECAECLINWDDSAIFAGNFSLTKSIISVLRFRAPFFGGKMMIQQNFLIISEIENFRFWDGRQSCFSVMPVLANTSFNDDSMSQKC